MNIKALIEQQIAENPVVLYMKGTVGFPQCGFSKRVATILDELGVKPLIVDILGEEGMRQGIKDFSNWPTLPQLYIQGHFIGGCDIVSELYQSGELKRIFEKAGILPTIE